ncbi:MAG: alanyl-tRNA editing protein [Actinomycetota bacterium]
MSKQPRTPKEHQLSTESVYLHDSYVRNFEAKVAATEDSLVALDRTAFYPGGGGQPHDLGTINGVQVTSIRRDSGLVWHELDGEVPSVGDTVTGELDWERRYALMRTHTAMHILCGVIWRDYGAKVTGGGMQPLKGRMDFEFEQMKAELVGDIDRAINEEVANARSISVRFLDRSAADVDPDLIRTKINLLPKEITEVRVVDIDGLDVQADGGTHVNATDEVGTIHIANYKSKGRANKRLEIALDPTS